jgi:hypothetical protein
MNSQDIEIVLTNAYVQVFCHKYDTDMFNTFHKYGVWNSRVQGMVWTFSNEAFSETIQPYLKSRDLYGENIKNDQPELNAEIVHQKKRLIVRMNYHKKTVEFFKAIEKFFWHPDLKQWSFPLNALQRLLDYFTENGIIYKERIDCTQPEVEIIGSNKLLKLKFNVYFKYFQELKTVTGANYDKETKQFSFPLSSRKDLVDFFECHDITHKQYNEFNDSA